MTEIYLETLLGDFDYQHFNTNYQFYQQQESDQIYQTKGQFLTNSVSGAKPLKESSLLLMLDEMKRKRLQEKAKTLESWGGMQEQEITQELKDDLQILKLNFFKAEKTKNQAKYFQVGTVLDGKDDFLSGRVVKKERKNRVIDEFLSEEQKESFSKRKFLEIQKEKQKFAKNRKFKKISKLSKKKKR